MQKQDLSYNRLEIQAQAASFGMYIDSILSENSAKELVDCVSHQVSLYVFSGVIRNFLLGYLSNRDIDFVALDSRRISIPLSLLRPISIRKNKFDGYKLTTGGLTIDCWDVGRTWGVLQEGMRSNPYSLLNTAFFNFSAIVYDYNHRRFLISDDFCKFYSTHTMEVVYAKNPRIDTCIINTLYYADFFGFSIGKSLKKWVARNFREGLDYYGAQISRFQDVVYSYEMILAFVEICRRSDLRGRGVVKLYDGKREVVLSFE
ncbi:MAG: hypothetical protein LIR46_05285 [Bacteroidota bacterium]|nr:hypothetical protein [Bacteroidota bacterium]